MDKTEEKGREHHHRAIEVLRRLNDLGAINLDILVSKAAEIRGLGGAAQFDAEDRICYPYYIHFGPRHELDLVSVANELQQLGFEVKRAGKA